MNSTLINNLAPEKLANFWMKKIICEGQAEQRTTYLPPPFLVRKDI